MIWNQMDTLDQTVEQSIGGVNGIVVMPDITSITRRIRMEEIQLLCPKCQKSFRVPDCFTRGDCEGCTMDCPHCQALLIMDKGIVKDFHQKLHDEDPRWPADGKGAGYLEL
jgi:hypothetical protein